ncbi:MAG: metal-dependent hydrolase [Clostridia bacterium]|nr:metal-dependent hydrolase [Clostridia bacterium]
MDPVTHVVVGAALAVVGGAEVSLTSPVLMVTTLGAVAPDMDIIYQYWGHYAYLKHHRGISHSLPGLLAFASLISGLLSMVFPGTSFFMLFLWAFLGGLSHTFLDLLNSYGVMIFYPFSRKKYTLNLLMITDPVLIGFSLALIYAGWRKSILVFPLFLIIIGYLILRLAMRRKAERLINGYYGASIEKLVVMPAFSSLINWDFIVRVNNKNIVGQINIITGKIKIHKRLKLRKEALKEILEKTKIGKFFKEFTPLLHIDYRIEGNKIIGRFTDLRYYVRNGFLHQATVILDNSSYQVEKALFQPYNPKNKIEIR